MTATADVAGVAITNPDRVVFPDQGITKRALAEYYELVGPRMLPHVAERPLSLVRCPQGQGTQCFFQKHWTTTVPAGVGVVQIREQKGEGTEPYLYVHDVQGLVSLVQHGVLEFHLWGARVEDVESPDRVVFDLDPAPDVPWSRVAEVAQAVREVLRRVGLQSWLKTSGGKGLHVVVPFSGTTTWNDVHDFARLTTARLVADDPGGLVDVASKAAREGRIFVDYLRNGRGATAIAPWSTRSRPGAPIAVPISWSALDALTGGDTVHVKDAREYLTRVTRDPWSAMLRNEQMLTEETYEKLLTT